MDIEDIKNNEYYVEEDFGKNNEEDYMTKYERYLDSLDINGLKEELKNLKDQRKELSKDISRCRRNSYDVNRSIASELRNDLYNKTHEKEEIDSLIVLVNIALASFSDTKVKTYKR